MFSLSPFQKPNRRSHRRKAPHTEALEAKRDACERALRAHDYTASARLLQELERLEPSEPRWPHKHGDLLRASSHVHAAAAAYRRAAERYAERGFSERARAMTSLARTLGDASAKLVSLHPSVAPDARHLMIQG
jgi:predicted Zn-dependent protease